MVQRREVVRRTLLSLDPPYIVRILSVQSRGGHRRPAAWAFQCRCVCGTNCAVQVDVRWQVPAVELCTLQ
eukprot:4842389-Prorocentrum_lima.AAC.1